ncbi:MAG: CZB domain-containing protein [Betaproteobacteria bacterium]
MESTVFLATQATFIELAKVDHLVFKFEVYKAFLGLSGKNASDFSSDTACRLGKWYQGVGKSLFAKLDGYSQLERPHQLVHQCGQEAVAKLRANDLAGGSALLAKMESASTEVIDCLNRISASTRI